VRLFAKKRSGPGTAVQLRAGQRHPFGVFDGYVPLGGGEDRLYRTIREAVPVLDAAILKIIRLAGGFSVRCGEPAAETALNEFLRTVNVGRGQAGFDAFLDQYLDSMITCGRAVGEIVTRGDGDIAAVLCGNVADVQIREGATPLDFTLCCADERGTLRPLPYQDLLLFTPFNPEADAPYPDALACHEMHFSTQGHSQRGAAVVCLIYGGPQRPLRISRAFYFLIHREYARPFAYLECHILLGLGVCICNNAAGIGAGQRCFPVPRLEICGRNRTRLWLFLIYLPVKDHYLFVIHLHAQAVFIAEIC